MLVYTPGQGRRMPEIAADAGHAGTAPAISGLIKILREARREQHITQLELSARLGVTEITVVEWETRRDIPATGNLFRWAHTLGYVVEIRESSSGKLLKDADSSSRARTVESRMRRIPRLLRQVRVERSLTQEELGAELDVSTWTVRMWESAQRTPRLVHLVAWCRILNCQLELSNALSTKV
jgi:transcriptional regulator with XRE-family HTH domain